MVVIYQKYVLPKITYLNIMLSHILSIKQVILHSLVYQYLQTRDVSIPLKDWAVQVLPSKHLCAPQSLYMF